MPRGVRQAQTQSFPTCGAMIPKVKQIWQKDTQWEPNNAFIFGIFSEQGKYMIIGRAPTRSYLRRGEPAVPCILIFSWTNIIPIPFDFLIATNVQMHALTKDSKVVHTCWIYLVKLPCTAHVATCHSRRMGGNQTKTDRYDRCISQTNADKKIHTQRTRTTNLEWYWVSITESKNAENKKLLLVAT